MLFESERLYTRYFTMEDLDQFFRLNGDEEIVRYIRAPKSYEECRSFLGQVIEWYKNEKINWRIALLSRENDEVIGSFAIIPIGDTEDMQLGYSLLKEQWGKGYATEITEAGARYAFDQLNYSSIAAITEAANIASQKVLLKCDFLLEAEYEESGKKMLRFRKENPGT
jgi:ribosomal-protein-alanine N-acetyltransferase